MWRVTIILLFLTASAQAGDITAARYGAPTTRYDHGVLGDAVEWGALLLETTDGIVTIRLPETRVFEDIAPRLVTGEDGEVLAMVVESDLSKGARLALYAPDGLRAATPFIGRSYRWLAPVGAGDLDGDGTPEFAYIDRPHLAKVLRVWRLAGGALKEVATLDGLTNHKIGWDFIPGGLRECGQGPELIVAAADWQDLVAVRFDGSELARRSLGPLESIGDFAEALACGR